jgi:hypothetical protein
MNIIYFLFFISPLNHKYDILLSKNNANLDFKESNTTISFKYYKKILEERKEIERQNRHKVY